MDLNTITVQDFKDLFFRDFPYLNVWLSSAIYNTDDEVYYEVNKLFYRCLNDSVNTVPTNVTDWVQYSDSVYNYILDADIEKAFAEAKVNFNQALFSTDEEITLAFLYLAAHFLVIDIRNSSQGVNSKGNYNAQSQTVGNVSESLYIPDKIANNSIFQMYTTTGYGMKYINLVAPRLVGRVVAVRGAINA